MNKKEMFYTNLLETYRIIKNKPSTAYEIAEKLNISVDYAHTLIDELAEFSIVETKDRQRIPNGNKSRSIYSLSDSHNCFLIYKKEFSYSFCAVSPNGTLIDGMKFPLKYRHLNTIESFNYYFEMLNTLKVSKYCHAVYLIGKNLDELYSKHDNIIKITNEDLILSSLVEDNKNKFVSYYDKNFLISNGEIKYTDYPFEHVSKLVTITETHKIDTSNEYDYIFDSVQRLCVKHIENFIKTL